MSDMQGWLDEFYDQNEELVEEQVEKKKKTSLLNIHRVLSAIDTRDKNFYSNLTADERKGFAPWLVMRWLSGTQANTEHYLLMTNDVVNCNFSDLTKHPELQWKLMCLCGIGKTQKHQWVAPGKKTKKDKLEEAILKVKPLLNDDELKLFIKTNSTEQLIDFLKDTGLDDTNIGEIFKRSKKDDGD